MFDIHRHIADLDAGALGEAVLDRTADHAADDAVLAEIVLALGERFNGVTVADDGDVVRHIGDLVELVGDDDGGHTLLLEFQQKIQQRLGIRLVEGGGRLVQDHKARLFCQRLGNLNHLLLADADVLDEGRGGLGQADDLQIFCSFGVGFVPVDGVFFLSQSMAYFFPCSLPRNMFSPMLMYGTRASS